ncbi:MAG: hypothetical protein WCH05_10275, partial [Chlorobiaceae bacterium]
MKNLAPVRWSRCNGGHLLTEKSGWKAAFFLPFQGKLRGRSQLFQQTHRSSRRAAGVAMEELLKYSPKIGQLVKLVKTL